MTPVTTTTVEKVNDDYVIISKSHPQWTHIYRAHIIKSGQWVIIAHPDVAGIHVSYIRKIAPPDARYEKWIHLIGKLSIKDITSKYFAKPIYSEHMKNGLEEELTQEEEKEITRIILDTFKQPIRET